MSTPDPSDVPCPCQQRYDKAHVCDIPGSCPCAHQGKHSAGDLMSVYDLTVLRIKADQIRAQIAQITPPAPPMEEPTEWGAKVTDDRGDWSRADVTGDDDEPRLRWVPRDWAKTDWSTWDDMQNPRPYENPREKPATGAESDAQGSEGGIGRVSESEAVEGGLDAWGKRMRAFGDSL